MCVNHLIFINELFAMTLCRNNLFYNPFDQLIVFIFYSAQKLKKIINVCRLFFRVEVIVAYK